MGISCLQLAEAAKAQYSHDYSDHLALIRAYQGWKDAERDLAGYDYCWKNFLSVQSMKAIDALRNEFYSLLKVTGLVDSNPAIYNAWSYDEDLLRAIVCYGLYPGICSIVVCIDSLSCIIAIPVPGISKDISNKFWNSPFLIMFCFL